MAVYKRGKIWWYKFNWGRPKGKLQKKGGK
jgi:hypothetical protein